MTTPMPLYRTEDKAVKLALCMGWRKEYIDYGFFWVGPDGTCRKALPLRFFCDIERTKDGDEVQ